MAARRRYGKREKVRPYFLRNPDEEMTLDDLIVMFDMNRHTAWDTVKVLKQEGLIERVRLYRLNTETKAALRKAAASVPPSPEI